MVLEKTFESLLDCHEIKLVSPKGNQPRIFIGRTDVEAEASILWPLDVKSQLTGKDCDAWKDCRKKKKGQQRMRWLDSITHSVDLNLNKLPQMVKEREAWHALVHGVTKSQKGTNSWPSAFMVQLLQPYMTTGKTIALTIWTFVNRVMSLLFNTTV